MWARYQSQFGEWVLATILRPIILNSYISRTKQWSTRRAHPFGLETLQDKPYIHPVSRQVYHLRETHVHGVCRNIKSTSLRDVSEDSRIPNFGQLFRMQIEEDWGHKVSGLMLRYNQNVLIDSIFSKLQNGLLYYCQPFHNPTSVESLGLDCKVEYSNANPGTMPEAHDIWVQYMQSEQNDFDNTFQGRTPWVPSLYFSCTTPNQILQFQEYLAARNTISTFSKRCKKTQQWVLCPQAQ